MIKWDSLRVALGFFIAPFSACLIGFVYQDWMAEINFMAAILAYPLGVIPGIPAYFLFRRQGWLKYWQTVAAAVAIGAAEGWMLYWISLSAVEATSNFHDWLAAEGGCSLAAFIVGTTFWVIAIGRFGRKPNSTRRVSHAELKDDA